jgi:glycosyltransferase involved in cell wall biosynthesis
MKVSIKKKQLLIISTCGDNWGGSEELWARSIPYLLNMGYEISVCKSKINFEHEEFKNLKAKGVRLHQLNPNNTYPLEKNAEKGLKKMLNKEQISLVLISQGINFDGLGMGYECLITNTPYVLIAQKAVESFWPYYRDRVPMRNVYLNANKALFVSNHNLKLTQEQFGTVFKNAEVISNPVKVKRIVQDYPNTNDGFRLACMGRLFLLDKGQDILIRIMAQEKWRARPLKISFIGSGTDKEALMELAQFFKLNNVEFLDSQKNVEELWSGYHGLIMPSRFEGTPLVLLEAMALGKFSIVTNIGGNIDLITDGVNGFLGQPNEVEFDNAMERAWNTRDNWQELGRAACQKIIETVPELPERNLANIIDKLMNQKSNLVTVIIPTYNRVNLLESAILSVLNQTYPNIQLIVADDGSVDETSSLMSKYPEVTYLKLKHGGQAHARNEGLRCAKGSYIASLDSDDFWEPTFLEKSVKLIDDNELDFVFSNWMQDLGNNNSVERFSFCMVIGDVLKNNDNNAILLNNKELRKIYLNGCPSPSSSFLMKRSSLNTKWSSGPRIADDWCLLLDTILAKPCSAGIIREVLWHKKQDGINICDGRDPFELRRDLFIHDYKYMFKRYKKFMSNAERINFKRIMTTHLFSFSYFQFRNKFYLGALKYSFLTVISDKRSLFTIIKEGNRKIKEVVANRF